MRSVGLRCEDDRRVSNSGGAGQPRSDDAEVTVLGVRSNSRKRRHRVAAPSTCAPRQKHARQSSHAVAVANSDGARGHAEAPANASLESASALLAPRRTGAQPPSPLPSWTASNAFHSRRHGP